MIVKNLFLIFFVYILLLFYVQLILTSCFFNVINIVLFDKRVNYSSVYN